MKRPKLIKEELQGVDTINNLTGAFESIASLRISQVKSEVLAGKEFFNRIWPIYTQLRVNPEDRITSSKHRKAEIDKNLYIVITAEGGLSGDIDEKLVNWMLNKYDAETTDIIVVGHHGVLQLAQKGISIEKYFKLPEGTRYTSNQAIVEEVKKYRSTTVFYQTYVSLAIQDIKSINLNTAVADLGEAGGDEATSTINSQTYIFEPSPEEVISYLETVMIGIAFSQVVLESKLAQYASRFNAMSAAHRKAKDLRKDLKVMYHRSKRAVQDERVRETIGAMKILGGIK